MPIECTAEKKLEEGSTLKIETWISDVYFPGKRVYQLRLESDGDPVFFPRTPNFSKDEIQKMYDDIKSKGDFEKIRKEYLRGK